MCYRVICIVCFISSLILCNGLRGVPSPVTPIHFLSGRWITKVYQTEWGPMREELTLNKDGTCKLCTFMPEDEGPIPGIIEFGNYEIKKDKLIFKELGKAKQLTATFRIDKMGRLILRYKTKDNVEIRRCYNRIRFPYVRKRQPSSRP